MKSSITQMFITIVIATLAVPVEAQIGTAFSYQGRLDQAGQPFNGLVDFVFDLYDDEVIGNSLGSQSLNGVAVIDGLFSVELNSNGEFGPNAFVGELRWLEISINGTTLSPRQAMTAAPNALFALTTAGLSLPYAGTVKLSSPGDAFKVTNTGSGVALSGQIDGEDGRGVFGWASASSGFTLGVYGLNDSQSGLGVLGTASASSGTTFGVYGHSNSDSGTGVYGIAASEEGLNQGVQGVSNSTQGRGVFGFSNNEFGGIGVLGRSIASVGGYGVRGEEDSNSFGWGVYAVGRLGSTGTKSFCIDHPDDPSGKYLMHYCSESPEVINFYRGTVVLDSTGGAVVELPHYFAKVNKSPSYQLTAIGAPMPMLHVAEEIDEAALLAGADAEPAETTPACTFRIAGGAPGAKVSWRVEAVRNDRWVQTHGALVEIEKPGLEKGTYQHPELYGQSPEMGLNYDAKREQTESDSDLIDPRPVERR